MHAAGSSFGNSLAADAMQQACQGLPSHGAGPKEVPAHSWNGATIPEVMQFSRHAGTLPVLQRQPTLTQTL